MTKVFRPFWSYDVQKTEAWLSSMSDNGYELVKINRATRCFYFRRGNPQKRTYRIGFDKVQASALSRGLVNEGWMKVLQAGSWYVMVNEKPLEQIKAFSAREGIIKHNNRTKYISAAILIYLSTIAFFSLILNLFLLRGGEVVDSPYWIITYVAIGIAIMLWVLTLYSVITITKTNKRLSGENRQKLQGEAQFEERLSNQEEQQLKSSGQLITKLKMGWMYAPDKLEKWLEGMEEQGFNLYRVAKTGTVFYFIVGSPRKMSYYADFQHIANKGYFDIHRDAGWHCAYASTPLLQKWTLWSREYKEGEERPRIYSDKAHQLKHARRIAITYSCMFLPLIAIYIYNIVSNMKWMSQYELSTMQLINMALFALLILTFGSFAFRTWLYYWRLSKH